MCVGVCVRFTVDSGDKYIVARKLIQGATELMYITTDLEFYLFSEDVRMSTMKHDDELHVLKSETQIILGLS